MLSSLVASLCTPAAFMLSTQLNYMAEENLLVPNCVCVLKRQVTNVLKDGRYEDFAIDFVGNVAFFLSFFLTPPDYCDVLSVFTDEW